MVVNKLKNRLEDDSNLGTPSKGKERKGEITPRRL